MACLTRRYPLCTLSPTPTGKSFLSIIAIDNSPPSTSADGAYLASAIARIGVSSRASPPRHVKSGRRRCQADCTCRAIIAPARSPASFVEIDRAILEDGATIGWIGYRAGGG